MSFSLQIWNVEEYTTNLKQRAKLRIFHSQVRLWKQQFGASLAICGPG